MRSEKSIEVDVVNYWGLRPEEKIVLDREIRCVEKASDTNRSRGVWSGREGPEEAVGGALEGA